jgi:hypothetical protein
VELRERLDEHEITELITDYSKRHHSRLPHYYPTT